MYYWNSIWFSNYLCFFGFAKTFTPLIKKKIIRGTANIPIRIEFIPEVESRINMHKKENKNFLLKNDWFFNSIGSTV